MRQCQRHWQRGNAITYKRKHGNLCNKHHSFTLLKNKYAARRYSDEDHYALNIKYNANSLSC